MHVYETYCRETFDEKGRLTQIQLDYPADFNFAYDVVDAMARLAPQQKALVWCHSEGQEAQFTFADISRRSSQAAQVFVQAGIRRGDRVMVALKRHYEYWFVTVALHKIGAVLIPMTHMLTQEDILYRLRCAPVQAIVCTPQDQVPARVAGAVAQAGGACKLWTVQQDIPGFSNLTRAMEEAEDTLDRLPTLATDPMIMYFTSGTTGQPKGVVHDFTYPLAHIVTAKHWQQAQDGGLHFTVAETGWGKASWGKIYGQWLIGSAVMVFDFDNFDPKRLVGIINQYGVTSFCAPPTVYRYLVKKGIPPMPTLRHAATAGEQLHPEIFRRFTQSTGLPLMEGYGQTETTLLLANLQGWEPLEGSMGVPSPLYHIQLQNPDGTPTPVGEIGEVVILPPETGKPVGLFTEYLGDPALYAQAWRGGVYHTGDAAWQDEKGYYWFHGRFDDIIRPSRRWWSLCRNGSPARPWSGRFGRSATAGWRSTSGSAPLSSWRRCPRPSAGRFEKPNSEPEGASGRPIHQAGGTEDGRAAKSQAPQHQGRAHQGRGGGDQPLRGGRVFHAADRPAVRGVLRRAL